MRQNNLLLLLIWMISTCIACKSTYDITKPNGIQSTLQEKEGATHDVELLSFDSNILYVLNNGKFEKYNIWEIKEIYAYELVNKGRKPILFFGGLGITGAGIAVISDKENRATGILTTGLGISIAFGGLSDMPKYKFKPPLTSERMGKLRLYCRFPQGLTQTELDYLESYYNHNKL